ncbi:hypothetical protein FBU30_004811 [Linnemannia zychae]|nr:hypothetical protein FBU30_004811 [Linnemannia zychae]
MTTYGKTAFRSYSQKNTESQSASRSFNFVSHGAPSTTLDARLTPTAASGTTAAPSTATVATAVSAAAAMSGVGVTSSPTPASAVPIGINGTTAAGTTTTFATAETNSASTGSFLFASPRRGIFGGGTTLTSSPAAVGVTTATSSGIATGSTTGQSPLSSITTTDMSSRPPEASTNPVGSNLSIGTIVTNSAGNSSGGHATLAATGTPPGPGRYFNNFATRPSLALAATQPTIASTTLFTPSIQNNGVNKIPQVQCVKEIRFRFEWSPENISILLGSGYTQQFRVRENDQEYVQCSLLQTSDTFKLTLDCTASNKSNSHSWLHTVSVYTTDKKQLVSTAVIWPNIQEIHCSWLKSDTTLVKSAAGLYGIDVVLSSEKPGIKFHTTTSTTYTDHCDSILGKMLDDQSSYDVIFEFDPLITLYEFETDSDSYDSETGSIEKIEVTDSELQQENSSGEETGGTVTKVSTADLSDQDLDNSEEKSTSLKSDQSNCDNQGDDVKENQDQESESTSESQDKKITQSETDKDVFEAMEDMKNALATIPSTPKRKPLMRETLGAHKVVLSQYEYFKTMFSSSFAEGGPGVKRIRIRDSDIDCFRLLIQFLYLGRIRLWNTPSVLTQDCVSLGIQPSWEDVYLIADRYNIPKLKSMASNKITQGLNKEWVVPFLFRTGYLFEDMRQALIKFIVKNCMSEISQKGIQEAYHDHPECTAIFGEIIAELWSSRS